VICLLVVYSVRKLSVDNAWKIAIVSGALVYVIVVVIGRVTMHVDVPYVAVIIGTIVSILLALVLEFFAFAVDYSRTENLQFEDDEYFYYVKAVPKVTVTAPEKTVKRINERQETSRMDELKQEKILKNQTDEMLLTKALQEELEIQELLEEELKH